MVSCWPVRFGRTRNIDGPVIMMLTSGDRPSDMGECEQLRIASLSAEADQAVRVAGSDHGWPWESGPWRGVPACGWRVAGAARFGGTDSAAGRRLRILLAEDSLVNQQLAVALLEGEGHTVTVANNGREAVAAAETGDVRRRADGPANAGDGRPGGHRDDSRRRTQAPVLWVRVPAATFPSSP